jgi:gluconate 5-dehydrogenase
MGAAIAEGFARVGAGVGLADLNGEVAERSTSMLAAEGCDVLALPGDVSERATVETWAAKASDRWGEVSVLVNCAGIWSDVPFDELTPTEWQRVLDVNLTGTFNTCQVFGRAMRKARRGSIINFSSLSGVRGFKRRAAYTVTKHAVIGLTRTLANEWGSDGVRVNAIGPGRFNTALAADKYSDPRVVEAFLQRVPLERIAEPEEMVGTIFFLASEMSAYITGQVLMVDGGFTAV